MGFKGKVLRFLRVAVLATLILSIASSQGWSDVSFYIDENNGVIGYGLAEKLKDARDIAYDDCIENGGVSPVDAGFSKKPGWGAISAWYEGSSWAVGTTASKPTKKQAKKRAKHWCKFYGGQDCQIIAVFHDTYTK